MPGNFSPVKWGAFLISLLVVGLLGAEPAFAAKVTHIDIPATVVKLPLAKGVTPSEAIQSMKLRANFLNFKLVAHQDLSAQLKAMGVKHVRMLDIYQFCKPTVAYEMVSFNMAYAAYLPCRIAVVQGKHGHYWLTMLNPKLLLSRKMPPALKRSADSVIAGLMKIIKAGADGAL